MTGKQIGIWGVIVGIIGIIITLIISNNVAKSQNMNDNKVGDKAQMAQVSDSGKSIQVGTMTGNIILNDRPTIVQPDAEKVRELESKIKDLTSYKGEFPNRPKLIVPTPKVDLVFYKEKTVPTGLARGQFEILFLNIGGVEAKNVRTKWTINDHDRLITGLQEWLALVGQPPMVIDNIPSGVVKGLTYTPEMTTYGSGKIKLTIDYTYTNANTNEEYSDQYSGFVLYENPRDDKVRGFTFSKAVE